MAANNDAPSPLDALSNATERAIISVGDSIALSLSNGYDDLAKSTQAIVFPRHSEEEKSQKRAAWEEEQRRHLHVKAALDDAEKDYKRKQASIIVMARKKPLQEDREKNKNKNKNEEGEGEGEEIKYVSPNKPLALPSFQQKKVTAGARTT